MRVQLRDMVRRSALSRVFISPAVNFELPGSVFFFDPNTGKIGEFAADNIQNTGKWALFFTSVFFSTRLLGKTHCSQDDRPPDEVEVP